MPRVTAPRSKRSKQEVEKEYSRIREEVDNQKTAANAKAAELDRSREAEIRRSVEGLSVDSVVQKFAGLNIEISKALTDLSQKLIAEVENLNNVREAAALEAKELERLHKIDIAATALDQMIEEYRTEKASLETEIS